MMYPLRQPILLALLLTGCAAAPTYAEVRTTAVQTGCWPGTYPTPATVTVTLGSGALPTGTPGPTAVPTAGSSPTPLPSTTPYPRCPAAGATIVPWPTPVPAAPPYPTMLPRNWQIGGDTQEAMQLPAQIGQLDLTVHPTANWRALAAVQLTGLTAAPRQVFARVLDPATGVWGSTIQLDSGASSLGTDRFAAAQIAVAGDSTVHAVWGASDADGALWTSASLDRGASWSEPQRLISNCLTPLDLAATADGRLALLALCRAADGIGVTLMTYDAARSWHAPVDTGARTWYGADGGAGMLFTWAERDAGRAYALASLDGGRTWGDIAPIAAFADVRRIPFASPICDPASDQLGAVWVCCADAQWRDVLATHYASVHRPGSSGWSPHLLPDDEADAIPLVSGAQQAWCTATAQSSASRTFWLAWVERQHTVMVRAMTTSRALGTVQP